MIRVKFEWARGHGEHNKIKEVVEFEDGTPEKEIEEAFEIWVWEQIGDVFYFEILDQEGE